MVTVGDVARPGAGRTGRIRGCRQRGDGPPPGHGWVLRGDAQAAMIPSPAPPRRSGRRWALLPLCGRKTRRWVPVAIASPARPAQTAAAPAAIPSRPEGSRASSAHAGSRLPSKMIGGAGDDVRGPSWIFSRYFSRPCQTARRPGRGCSLHHALACCRSSPGRSAAWAVTSSLRIRWASASLHCRAIRTTIWPRCWGGRTARGLRPKMTCMPKA